MSFRRHVLIESGLFDPRFNFGGEEFDLCLRVRARFPGLRLLLEPAARVAHEFTPTLRDTLRRSRAYGRGSARMFVKWPSMRPALFPVPGLVVGLLLAASRRRAFAALGALVPLAAFPYSIRQAVRERGLLLLLDAYLQLAQEASENVGFVAGWLEFRRVSWNFDEADTPSVGRNDEYEEAA